MSFFGGFGSGLVSGASSGMQLANFAHQMQAYRNQQADAQAYGDLASQDDAEANIPLPPIPPNMAPQQAPAYQDQPADLSTIPHPQAVHAPSRSALPVAPSTTPSATAAEGPDAAVTGQQNPLSTPSATSAEAPRQQQISPTGSTVGEAVTGQENPLSTPSATSAEAPRQQQISPTGSTVGEASASPYAAYSTMTPTTGARTQPDTAPSNMQTYDDKPNAVAPTQPTSVPTPPQSAIATGPVPSATAAEAPRPSATAQANPANPASSAAAPQVAQAAAPAPAPAIQPDRPGQRLQDWHSAVAANHPPQPSPMDVGGASNPTATAATPAAPPAPTPAPTAQKSLGAKILSAINPISQAEAAPARPPQPAGATPAAAQGDTPKTPPGPSPQGALPTAPATPTPTTPAPAKGATTGVSASGNEEHEEHIAPIEKGMPPPARINLPVVNKPIVSGQSTPTVQSEPTPTQGQGKTQEARHFPVNPQSLAWLAKNRPEDAQLVQQIADKHGISPERLAAHWYQESRLMRSSKDGAAGEKGVMQVMPGTQAEVDPHQQLDPSDYKQSLEMGARYIRKQDDMFGRDTVSSVMAYNGGPGAANEAAAGIDSARVKNASRYASSPVFFGGKVIAPSDFTTQAHFDPDVAVQQADQAGPSGLLRYIASAQPKNMTLGAKWQAFQNQMVMHAIQRGSSMQEIQATQDWVSQQAQKGANQALMGAHKALVLGDGYTAAQYLARAHAFFPDGTVGKFGVDDKGQVWATRVDEGDPSKQLGPPSRVSIDQVQMMLAQSQDTRSYLKMVQEQQKTAATLKLEADRGAYYTSNAVTRGERLQQQDQQFKLKMAEQQNVRQQQENQRQFQREMTVQKMAEQQNVRQQQENQRQFQRETTVQKMADAELGQEDKRQAAQEKTSASVEKYWGKGAALDTGAGPDAAPLTPDQTGMGSMVHRAVRAGDPNITDPEAYRLGLGVATGKLRLVPMRAADGTMKYGIFDPARNGGQAQAMIDQADGDRLYGLQSLGQSAVRNAGLPTAPNPNSSRMPSRAETGSPITPMPRTAIGSTPMPTSQAIH